MQGEYYKKTLPGTAYTDFDGKLYHLCKFTGNGVELCGAGESASGTIDDYTVGAGEKCDVAVYGVVPVATPAESSLVRGEAVTPDADGKATKAIPGDAIFGTCYDDVPHYDDDAGCNVIRILIEKRGIAA